MISVVVTIKTGESGEKIRVLKGTGNGRLDAVSNAVRKGLGLKYELKSYSEHALDTSSKSQAISYVELISGGSSTWGAGIHPDIVTSSIYALISAVNLLQG
jgi:2-isopropylmalate synthase